MTETDILDTWLLKKSPKTQQMYAATWQAFFAWARTPAAEVTVPLIHAWLAQLPGSPATHTRKIRTLRSYYAWGIALGAWTDNPFERLETPDPPTRLAQRIPSAEDLHALVQAADQDSPAAYAFIHLLMGTGCALHALTLAHWTDWQPDASLWILASHGHHRPVPLAADTQTAIQRWHETLAPASPATPIFPSPKKPAHSLTVSALTDWFHRLTTAARLPDTLTPRWLRNYYGLSQLQHGVPLSVVQHRMGHAWILTTLPYEALAKKLPPSS